MNINLLKQKTNIIKISFSIFLVAVIFISFFQGNQERVVRVSRSDTSQAQERIDTKLSISKSSPLEGAVRTKSNASIKNIIPLALAAQYSGCKLDFFFNLTNGNISTAGDLSYNLSAQNIGSTACDSASLSIYYGEDETFVSSNPRPSAGNYYWKLGSIQPDARIDINLNTKRGHPFVAGYVTNEACITANNGLDVCRHSSTVVQSNTIPTIVSTPSPLSTPNPNVDSQTISTSRSSFHEYGVWIWDPISAMSTSTMQNIVKHVSNNNFNVVYLTIDEYLDLYALPDGSSKNQQLNTYKQKLSDFISLAKQNNIQVDAEAGWRDWAKPTERYKALAVLEFVNDYNNSHTQKFRGIQYDVEPYLLPEYEGNKANVLSQFVGLVNDVVTQGRSVDMSITFVIPHFYDAGQKWTPQITFGGKKDYTFNHLARLMSQLKDPNIILMSYRNFAYGKNGTVDISEEEIQYASDNYPEVKIIIAQETGDVDPAYVTFYGLSREELFAQVDLLNNEFSSKISFGGIAIHYLDTFLELR